MCYTHTGRKRWDGAAAHSALSTGGLFGLRFYCTAGDMFVGKFTSNLDRIAFSLLAAAKQGLVPFVSLDSNWCSDWARNAGKSVFGNFYC